MVRLLCILVAVSWSLGCSNSGNGFVVQVQDIQAVAQFGAVRSDQNSTQTITVQKPFIPPAVVDVIAQTGPFAPAAGALPASVGSGLDFTFDVEFDPTSTEATGTLRLQFTKADGTLVQTVLVTLTAVIEQPQPLIVPTTFDFGRAAVGQTAPGAIEIRNPNLVTPLEITGIGITGTRFDLGLITLPIVVGPDSSASIPVNYLPSILGLQTTSATITPSIGLPSGIQLRGEGIAEEIAMDLGFVPVGLGGETADIMFDIPAEAISFHLEIVGDDPFGEFDLSHLEAPDGEVVADGMFNGPYFWFLGSPVGFSSTMFLQFPNGDEPRLPLMGGTYRMRLRENGGNTGYSIRLVIEQRHQARVTDCVLPLNVFLANSLAVNAAGAAADPLLQSILGSMDTILATRGMRLGAISYFDVADPALDVIESDAELDTLFMGSAVAPETRLNLFFVDGFGGTIGDILGIAGALPGPKLNGTIFSGVAVDLDAGNAATVGSTCAHEAGHYLGLLHTTEFDDFGDILDFDTIADTQICLLDETDALCPTIGNDNLMWPFDLGLEEAHLLTRGQADIMKNHPLVMLGMPPAPVTEARFARTAEKPSPSPVWAHHCGTCARNLRKR